MRNWQKTEERVIRKYNSVKLSLFCIFMSDILCYRKEWYCPLGSDIVRLCLTVIFYSPPNSRSEYHLDEVQISLQSNITRRRRIKLAWYSVKSITPRRSLLLFLGIWKKESGVCAGDSVFRNCFFVAFWLDGMLQKVNFKIIKCKFYINKKASSFSSSWPPQAQKSKKYRFFRCIQ